MHPRVAVSVAVALILVVLVALMPSGAQAAPAGNRSPRAVLADLNGNRLSDDFESELAKASPNARFQVIVRFTDAGSETAARQAVGAFAVSRRFALIKGIAATMTAAQIRALSRNTGTFRIEKDFVVKVNMDAARRDFGVDAARSNFGATGAGVEICVVDTGVNPNHEQLDNGKVIAFADFIGPNQNVPAYDDQGHGTHVASIAAGDGVGGLLASKYQGVAPAAAISAAKVISSNGTGPDSGVLAGLDWCANRASVRVISMSLGSESPSDGSDSMSQAVDNAVQGKNKIVVAAAGNSGDSPETVVAPGAAASSITVGSVAKYSAPPGAPNHSEGIYLDFFSSRGPVVGHPERIKPDVVSPGDSIAAAYYASSIGYIVMSGTSMATPFISGVIALGLQMNGAMSPATAKSLIQSTAQDWGPAGKDNDWGSGLVDAAAFVAQAAGSSGSTQFPTHTRVTGSVSGGGQWTYQFTLGAGDLATPIGATIIVAGQPSCILPVGNECWWWGEWDPDLDAELKDPNGAVIAESTCALGAECGQGRQETLHAMPTLAGTYTIRVYPFSNVGGTFALDLSRGPAGGGGPPPPPANNPPTANAGPDQTVSDADANGSQSVGLNGSLSSDSDGTIASSVWKEGATQIATGATPTLNLGIGTHTLTLTVTDDDGATGSDQVVVTVTRAASAHVGDIDATRRVGSSSWRATATITVHSATETLVKSGTVSGSWNGGPTVTCALTTKGKCSITKTGIPLSQANITFAVTGISTGSPYAPAYNHDPDGSSNGTSILIVK